MPRKGTKHRHPQDRYERIMLAAINSLPFTFHSPGQPNLKNYRPTGKERVQRTKDRTIKGQARKMTVGKTTEKIYIGEEYAPYVKMNAAKYEREQRN